MGILGSIYRNLTYRPEALPSSLNFTGKTILVTGSTAGIGSAVVQQCVQLDASLVIIAARNIRKGEGVKQEILKQNPSKNKESIQVWELDLESPQSVKEFGLRAQTLGRVDIAILNAAVFSFSWSTNPETGLEQDIHVNHLCTAMLALLLLPVLNKTAQKYGQKTRLTFTSSEVHEWAKIPDSIETGSNMLKTMSRGDDYDPMNQYCRSKLLGVLWARELVKREQESQVIVNMLNPGSVKTDLHRDGNAAIQAFDKLFGRTSEQAARLVLSAAAVHGANTHGEYLSENRVVP